MATAPQDAAVARRMLAWALEQELPAIQFDEDMVEGLADEWRGASNVAKAWAPFLLARMAAFDDDGAIEVGLRILERIREAPDAVGGGGAPPRENGVAQACDGAAATAPGDNGQGGANGAQDCAGLEVFLESLRLQQYSEKAVEWCRREGVRDVNHLLRQSEDFIQACSLKYLEGRRVRKEVEARAVAAASGAGPAAFDPAPRRSVEAEPTPSPAVQEALRLAALEGRITFGSPSDPYIVYDHLGQGAAAHVYKCSRASTPSGQFAVKIITRSLLHADKASAEEKLRRETEILFSLRHVNIVSLYEVFESKEKLYLVMEYVGGGDLYNVIVSKGVLSEEGACHVFLQLVSALRYIHSKSVVHRDLKLENILVDTKSSQKGLLDVKITDFGQSKLVDNDSMLQTWVGTVQYMAPEVLEGRTSTRMKAYDEKVDLWSLGVVLYVILEGAYPFEGQGMEQKVNTASFDFAKKSKSSPAVRSLIRSLIKVRPSDRLALDECLKHEWVRTQQGPNSKFMKEARKEQTLGEDEAGRQERFSIPGEPQDEETLRRELWQFTTEFSFSAVLRKKEVVVTWSSNKGGNEDAAREKLLGILSRHFPAGRWSQRRGAEQRRPR